MCQAMAVDVALFAEIVPPIAWAGVALIMSSAVLEGKSGSHTDMLHNADRTAVPSIGPKQA